MSNDVASLFDQIERPSLRVRRNAEPEFNYLNFSGRPTAARVRALMDAWFLDLPQEGRTDVRSRFRRPDDSVHLGAYTELYGVALLRAHGFQVESHAYQAPNGRRVDFLAKTEAGSELLIECVVSLEPRLDAWEHQLVRSAYDTLNALPHPDFFLIAELRVVGSEPPSGRNARRFVEEQLMHADWAQLAASSEADGLDALPEWTWRDQGWEIAFKPLPKAPEYRGTQDGESLIIGAQMDTVRTGVPGERWVTSLEKKASDYGEPPLPFVILINGLSMFHTMDTLPDALFGKRMVTMNKRTGEHALVRAPDGLWIGPRGPRNRQVSAVMALRSADPSRTGQAEIQLIHNPWATNPLSAEPWLVNQVIKDEQTGKMDERPGTSAAELFGLPRDWPGTD